MKNKDIIVVDKIKNNINIFENTSDLRDFLLEEYEIDNIFDSDLSKYIKQIEEDLSFYLSCGKLQLEFDISEIEGHSSEFDHFIGINEVLDAIEEQCEKFVLKEELFKRSNLRGFIINETAMIPLRLNINEIIINIDNVYMYFDENIISNTAIFGNDTLNKLKQLSFLIKKLNGNVTEFYLLSLDNIEENLWLNFESQWERLSEYQARFI
jgi:hypothetical protein